MTHVPCNGCTACCKGQRIILGREDDGEIYVVEGTVRGNDGAIQTMLAHKPNGDCWYLGPDGCTIHGRAPKACRDFDCRKWYALMSRSALPISTLDKECAMAAIRLAALSPTE